MNKLFVISGPAGVGKGTVISALRAAYPEIVVPVSATTRKPREGEVDGVHYHFITSEKFDELIDADAFIEWAWVHKVHRYGTLKCEVEAALQADKTVILEIDVQGASLVKKAMPAAHVIFLAPPSWQELESRLRGRGSETEESIARRLATARAELDTASQWDSVVVNDSLEATLAEMINLIGLGKDI